MTMVENITNSFERIRIAPVAPIESPRREFLYGEIDGPLFTQQPWVIPVDKVLHRRRGILITHDTYHQICLSFENVTAACSFLGEVLAVVSASDSVVRVSELQLEEANSQWDEKPRAINPQFAPVNLPLIMATKTVYSLSTTWEIVKTVYYIAISQYILDKLCEEAICRSSLNGLVKAQALPMVGKLPDIRLPELSVELEVTEALKSASLKETTNDPSSELVSFWCPYQNYKIMRLTSWNSCYPS